jgi:phenylalanine-4-hydroxylase
MAYNSIVIDVCRENDSNKLEQLVSASRIYWFSKGYSLISDEYGDDSLRIFGSSIKNGQYDEGVVKYPDHGDVILVYQRSS